MEDEFELLLEHTLRPGPNQIRWATLLNDCYGHELLRREKAVSGMIFLLEKEGKDTTELRKRLIMYEKAAQVVMTNMEQMVGLPEPNKPTEVNTEEDDL